MDVLRVGDLESGAVESLLGRYGLAVEWITDDAPITASFWGDPEAGVVGRCVFIRSDTPVHSMLHEACHIICMTADRRERLDRDAGGDDLEESAVCFLQIILADLLAGVGRDRLMADMDAWGYSFRLGATSAWFDGDAQDAMAWLQEQNLITKCSEPVYRLRDT